MRQLEAKNVRGIESPIYIGVIFILVTVALNKDWGSVQILWWSIVALFILTSLFVQFGRFRDVIIDKTYMVWLLCFFGLCAFSILWALSSSLVLTVLKSMLIHSVIFLLLIASVKSIKDVEILMGILLSSCLVNAIYLMIQNIEMLTQSTDETIDRLGVEGNWNANEIGMMMSVSILLLLYFFGKTKSGANKALIILAIGFLTFVSFLSGSRKAFIVVLMSIMLYVPFKSKGKRVRAVLFALALAVVAFFLIMNVPFFYSIIGWRVESFFSLYTGEGQVDGSTIYRQKLIAAAFDTWQEYPLLGCGIDCFRIFGEIATGKDYYAHNNYLELLADLGVVGFICYYWGYIYVGSMLWKYRDKDNISKVLLMILCILLIISLAFVHYSDFFFGLIIMLMFAYVSVCKKADKQE